MKSYNLFLDDVRNPRDVYIYTGNTTYLGLEWDIVRDYDSFVKHIIEKYKKGMFIDYISFDHDLADIHYKLLQTKEGYEEYIVGEDHEKTGYDCILWLKDFMNKHKLRKPKMLVHSMNVIGSQKIQNIINEL
ncbi:MAG: cyclic-phosphate processing receiver domain-containing protein [Bacilli bacterium]